MKYMSIEQRKHKKDKMKAELEEITKIWKNGSIEAKLHTYGIKNLIKLANYKQIYVASTMNKLELVSILKNITLVDDLPIR